MLKGSQSLADDAQRIETFVQWNANNPGNQAAKTGFIFTYIVGTSKQAVQGTLIDNQPVGGQWAAHIGGTIQTTRRDGADAWFGAACYLYTAK